MIRQHKNNPQGTVLHDLMLILQYKSFQQWLCMAPDLQSRLGRSGLHCTKYPAIVMIQQDRRYLEVLCNPAQQLIHQYNTYQLSK